jgi:fused signal recognition particle receptor
LGGVILGICAEHPLAFRYVGIGERAEDLREFNAEEFVEAMLGTNGQEAS